MGNSYAYLAAQFVQPAMAFGTTAVIDADRRCDHLHSLLRDAHGVEAGGDHVAEAGTAGCNRGLFSSFDYAAAAVRADPLVSVCRELAASYAEARVHVISLSMP